MAKPMELTVRMFVKHDFPNPGDHTWVYRGLTKDREFDMSPGAPVGKGYIKGVAGDPNSCVIVSVEELPKMMARMPKFLVNWLLASWHAGRSTILADEMGLGKTCQLLLTLQWLVRHRAVHGPFLVVAPVSTLGHWQREVLAWTDLSCVVLHGPADSRRALFSHEFSHTDGRHRTTGALRFHVLVTAPSTLCAEAGALRELGGAVLNVE